MCAKSADFRMRNRDARLASQRVEEYLRSCVKVVDVQNVEDDKDYRSRDIDLLCILQVGGSERTVSIEIKADTKAHKTGNFFFETLSNASLRTKGCFLKSQADLLFYYLMGTDRLYIFPMKRMQEWFAEVQRQLKSDSSDSSTYDKKQFQQRKTHTTDSHGKYHHTTIGQCVGIGYTKECLRAEDIAFQDIGRMGRWRCTLTDFCLEEI